MNFSAIYLLIPFTLVIGLILLAFGRIIRPPFSHTRVYQVGLYFMGVLALVSAWYIFLWFHTPIDGHGGPLAPWSMFPELAPPVGTWQRTLNDFFDQAPNAYLPAIGAVGISLGLFIMGAFRAARNSRWGTFPLVFAATHLAFVAIEFLLAVVGVYQLPDLWLPQPRTMPDIGYHRTWPLLLITLILLGLLYWQQGKIVIRYGAKRDGSPA